MRREYNPDCWSTVSQKAVIAMKTLSFPSAYISLVAMLLGAALASGVTAADVGVHIRFGLNDKEPTVWNGTVSVRPGNVALLSGWRFQQGDRADGASWTASTRPLPANLRTNAAKAKAGAKAKGKGAAAVAKAKAKAGAAGDDLA